MLESRTFWGLFSVGLIACGGGSSSSTTTDAAKISDAPANSGVVCSQQGPINTTTALDFSGGQAQGAAPTGGGPLEIDVVITTNMAGTVGLLMVQANTGGVYSAAAGKAGRFEKPPAVGTYPLDAEDTFGFGIDFVDGITSNADGTVNINPKQVQILDATAKGTVTIDAWSAAAVPNGTSTISATIANAKFIGHDVLADGSLSQTGNGCDITIQTLQFKNLSVKWQAAAFPAVTASAVAPRAHAARTLDGAAVFSLEPR